MRAIARGLQTLRLSLAPMYEALRAGSKLALAAAFHARALAPTCIRGCHATYTLLPSGRLHAHQASDIFSFLGSAYTSAALGSPSPSQAYFSVTSLTPYHGPANHASASPPSTALDTGGSGGGGTCCCVKPGVQAYPHAGSCPSDPATAVSTGSIRMSGHCCTPCAVRGERSLPSQFLGPQTLLSQVGHRVLGAFQLKCENIYCENRQ